MTLRRAIGITGLVSLVAAPALGQVAYPDFSSTSGLTLNGASAPANNGTDPDPVLRLATAVPFSAGSAFTSGAVCLSAFSTTFQFRIGNAGPVTFPDSTGQLGADGLTLTLQRTAPTMLGGAGGGLGYQGLVASVAVEFDTWLNSEYADPSSNHVGINVNGNLTSVATQPVAGRFDDGALWTAWVDYDGAVLEVRVSNTGLRPAAPTLSLPIDIAATLGSSTGFAGFTSATGGAFGNHDVVSWSFDEECAGLVIDGCATGVADHRLPDGSLFSVGVQACALDAANHGEFVACVAALGNRSMKARTITGREKGSIQSCAARASYYTGTFRTGEFIVNGGFETGDTTGWMLTTTSTGGVWTVNNGTLDPLGPATPLPPIDGAFDLVSHQSVVHTNRAMQLLNVPLEVQAATLTWSDRIRSYAAFADPGQEYRVVIRALDLTPIAVVFSTDAGDPLQQPGPNARTFDLTAALQALRGQTVVVSFEQQAQFSFLTLTLDRVSLVMTYR